LEGFTADKCNLEALKKMKNLIEIETIPKGSIAIDLKIIANLA